MDQKLICTDRTFETRVNSHIKKGWRVMNVGGVAASYSTDKRVAKEPRIVLWAVLERWDDQGTTDAEKLEEFAIDYPDAVGEGYEKSLMAAVQG